MIRNLVTNRILWIVISVLFLVGGAVNDGLTAWLWGLPFLIILYKSLHHSRLIRILICGVVLMIVIGISYLKWTSSLVFPVVGQQVKLSADIYLVPNTGPDHRTNTYEYVSISPDCSGPTCSFLNAKLISKGSLFVVNKVDVVHYPDFDIKGKHRFFMSNNSQEFIVHGKYVENFCKSAEWEFCKNIDKTPKVGVLTKEVFDRDPMNKPFRWLASLMFYPILPVAVIGYLSDLFSGNLEIY